VFKNIAVVLLSVIIVSLLHCGEKQTIETDQEKIREYLKTVNEYNMKDIKTFSATLSQSNRGDSPVDSKYYEKRIYDGSILTRIETVILNKKSITIQNPSGMYIINDGQVYKYVSPIKMKKEISSKVFKEIDKPNPVNNVKPENDKTMLSMDESEYDGVSCFNVTINNGASKEDLKKQADNLRKYIPKDRMEKMKHINIEDMLPIATELCIGKADKFIYKTTTYNGKGKCMSKKYYSSVKINCELSNELFEIPGDMKIVEIENIIDMYKNIKKGDGK